MTRLPVPNPAHVPPRRYTTGQVCALFAVGAKTVKLWERQGLITRAGSDGHSNMYDAAEIDAIRAAGTQARRP